MLADIERKLNERLAEMAKLRKSWEASHRKKRTSPSKQEKQAADEVVTQQDEVRKSTEDVKTPKTSTVGKLYLFLLHDVNVSM